MMSAVYYVLKDKSPVKLWSFKERNELILSLRSRRNLNPVGNLTRGAGYEKIPVGRHALGVVGSDPILSAIRVSSHPGLRGRGRK